jgi:transcription elongation factor Elf1
LKTHESEHHLEIFSCELCYFKSKHKSDMNDHETEKHLIKCDHCGDKFVGEVKLKKHLCRKHVPYPDYMDMYVKNWIRRGDCVPVFSKRMLGK